MVDYGSGSGRASLVAQKFRDIPPSKTEGLSVWQVFQASLAIQGVIWAWNHFRDMLDAFKHCREGPNDFSAGKLQAPQLLISACFAPVRAVIG